ncbi:PAS domain S-box protein [Maridesulfovibrio ferrireducens]|uniref:PAS domain-containing sensor histidine kinase n=1 Tax=Maridesulfovibrio ferrireducens TaxID=246191 RepID=UPI001A248C22|nr:PAS domain S-box protein [Maridesulfovibrio ferrireducens]MBI9110880.1 PAS domain S-box protein [Maridesulfovibrio ferrireducens]
MKIKSIHTLNERIRNYLCFFLTIFIACSSFSLLLFFWMINSEVNERVDTWGTYFSNRIDFIENIMQSKSSLDYGLTSILRVSQQGEIFNSRPHPVKNDDISRSSLFNKIKYFKPGQICLIQKAKNNNQDEPTLFLTKRLDNSFVIAEFKSETLLPVSPKDTDIFIFDKENECIFYTSDKYNLHEDKIRKIMFSSFRIFASAKIKNEKAGSITVVVAKDISAEFYGATLFMILALATVLIILKRSTFLTWDLEETEEDFVRIKNLLANVSMLPGEKLNHLPAIEYAAEKIRKVNWEAEAEKMSFIENQKYILTTSFFAGNILRLLDEITAHSKEIAISRQEYKDLVQRVHSIIIRMDLNGNCTFFNEYAESFFGFTQEEMLGKSIIGTIIPRTKDNDSDLEKLIHEMTTNPELTPISNNQNVRKDGSSVWIYWSNSPVYDDDGNTVEILSVGTDITERKRVELELHRTRNYIKNIIDSMPSIIIGVNSTGEIVHFNSNAEKNATIAANQLLGKKVEEAFPSLAKYTSRIEKAIETGIPETEIRTPQDSQNQKYQDIMIYPLSGDIKGAVIRIDDATERARIEEIMIQTEKMMSIGGLAAGMAHEINNPLGGILQGIQNIIRRFSPDLAPNIKAAEKAGCNMNSVLAYMEDRKIIKTLEGITESGVRAAEIVSRMLEFSRKSDSSKASCDIRILLDKSISLATQDYNPNKKYDFKQIKITRDYAEFLNPVLCAGTEIEQVFLNLLRNSAQAMDDWKEMEAQPEISVKISNLGDMVKCTISDNGPGINKDTRKRIFEPFYTTKDPGYGTGLGLSVSYFIITQNHKGSLSVESSQGKGTTFTILLPAIQN